MHEPCGDLWLLVASQYLSYALLPVNFCCLSIEASLPRVTIDCIEANRVSDTATTTRLVQERLLLSDQTDAQMKPTRTFVYQFSKMATTLQSHQTWRAESQGVLTQTEDDDVMHS